MHHAQSALGPSLALGARIVLGIALVASGTAKLRSRADVRAQMRVLIGERAATLIAGALPFVELIVAVALVAWWSAVPGASAVVLLVAFTAVLVRAQARHVPCPCFGAVRGGAPVGPSSIVRNGVLAALAVLAIGSPSGAAAGATVAGLVGMGAAAALAIRAAR